MLGVGVCYVFGTSAAVRFVESSAKIFAARVATEESNGIVTPCDIGLLTGGADVGCFVCIVVSFIYWKYP